MPRQFFRRARQLMNEAKTKTVQAKDRAHSEVTAVADRVAESTESKIKVDALKNVRRKVHATENEKATAAFKMAMKENRLSIERALEVQSSMNPQPADVTPSLTFADLNSQWATVLQADQSNDPSRHLAQQPVLEALGKQARIFLRANDTAAGNQPDSQATAMDVQQIVTKITDSMTGRLAAYKKIESVLPGSVAGNLQTDYTAAQNAIQALVARAVPTATPALQHKDIKDQVAGVEQFLTKYRDAVYEERDKILVSGTAKEKLLLRLEAFKQDSGNSHPLKTLGDVRSVLAPDPNNPRPDQTKYDALKNSVNAEFTALENHVRHHDADVDYEAVFEEKFALLRLRCADVIDGAETPESFDKTKQVETQLANESRYDPNDSSEGSEVRKHLHEGVETALAEGAIPLAENRLKLLKADLDSVQHNLNADHYQRLVQVRGEFGKALPLFTELTTIDLTALGAVTGGSGTLSSASEILAEMRKEITGVIQSHAALQTALVDNDPPLTGSGNLDSLAKELKALVKQCGETHKSMFKTWRRVQSEAQPLVGYARRLGQTPEKDADLPVNVLNEQLAEVNQALSQNPGDAALLTRQAELTNQKQLLEASHETGVGMLTLYADACSAAARGNYGEAIAKLFTLQGQVAQHQQASEQRRQELMKELKAKKFDSSAFDIDFKKVKLDRILDILPSQYLLNEQIGGFDTTRHAASYAGGQLRAEDGTLVMAKELRRMADELSFAAERFRELVALGCNPEEIASTCFGDIPENFWPPSAVRIVATFRRAEETFEAEETGRRVSELLRAEGVIPELQQLDEQGNPIDREALADEAKAQFATRLQKLLAVKGNVTGAIQEKGGEPLEKMLAAANVPPQLASFLLDKVVYLGGLADRAVSHHETWIQSFDDEDYESPAGDVSNVMAVRGTASSAKSVLGDVKDIVSQSIQSRAADEGTIKKKIHEYKRNRAAIHLVLDIYDFINSAGGLSTFADEIPFLGAALGGMDCLGSLVKDALEAVHYFKELGRAAADTRQASKDPESCVHLALFQQSEEFATKGVHRAIKALEDILNFLGPAIGVTADAVEVAGAAAYGAGIGAGASLKVTKIFVDEFNQFLMWGTDKLFTIKGFAQWAVIKAELAKAKQHPPDYDVIKLVFANSRKYAEFCIADQAIAGDPWARGWLRKRGLTDREMDDPDTATTIIREYLNLTAEGYLGNEQDEEISGGGLASLITGTETKIQQAKQAASFAKDKTSSAVEYLHDKYYKEVQQAINAPATLTYEAWSKLSEEAVKEKGVKRDGGLKAVGKAIKALDKPLEAFNLDEQRYFTHPGSVKGGDATSAWSQLSPEQQMKEAEQQYVRAISILSSLKEVSSACAAYAPADYDGNPHLPMRAKITKLRLAADTQIDGFKEHAENWSGRTHGWDPQDLQQKRKERAEELFDEHERIMNVLTTDRNQLLDELLAKYPFAMPGKITGPFGNPNNLRDAAAEKLQVAPGSRNALDSAVDNVLDAFEEEVRAELRSAGIIYKDRVLQRKLDKKEVEKRFARVAAAAHKIAFEDLLQAFANHAGPSQTPQPVANIDNYTDLRDESKWTAVAQQLKTNCPTWEGDQAPIAKVIQAFKAIDDRLNKDPVDEKARRRWKVASDNLLQAIGSISIETGFGTIYASAKEYRDKMSRKIEAEQVAKEIEFTNLGDFLGGDSLKFSAADLNNVTLTVASFEAMTEKAEKELAVAISRHPSGNQPTMFKRLRQRLMQKIDPSSYTASIRGSINLYEIASNNSDDRGRKAALLALKADIARYKPVFEKDSSFGGRPHPGMQAYIDELDKLATAELATPALQNIP